MALSVTRAVDYAVRAMVHIASLPEGGIVLRRQVALAEGIPSSFMAKVLARLARANLLGSARGVQGGFTLARAAAEISVLDIFEAIEGPLVLTSFRSSATVPGCPTAIVWAEIERSLRATLGSVSLEMLASAPRRSGRVASLAHWQSPLTRANEG